jgi:hypothetical protein
MMPDRNAADPIESKCHVSGALVTKPEKLNVTDGLFHVEFVAEQVPALVTALLVQAKKLASVEVPKRRLASGIGALRNHGRLLYRKICPRPSVLQKVLGWIRNNFCFVYLNYFPFFLPKSSGWKIKSVRISTMDLRRPSNYSSRLIRDAT